MKSSSLFESPISYSLETIKKGEDEKVEERDSKRRLAFSFGLPERAYSDPKYNSGGTLGLFRENRPYAGLSERAYSSPAFYISKASGKKLNIRSVLSQQCKRSIF